MLDRLEIQLTPRYNLKCIYCGNDQNLLFNSDIPTDFVLKAIQTIITPYNYSRVIEMYKFCRENNIILYFETVLKKEKASKNSDLYLANDKIRNIFEIWNEETYKNIRQSALNLKGLCKICKLHNEKKCFYGCRAHAYINTGEINGEYSECWHGEE